ncbi:MAG: CHAT domain-containing protein [Synechococcales bacterium]|nr:CHAT domain-containing protein [Synechococcales bacterium]
MASAGAIALAPDGTGKPNDGLLTTDELLEDSVQLTADLVVLSGCDTGQGRITGDGVIGLSRSFLAAGVPSVVVSLWAISDQSTTVLMTEFYRNLQTTSDKATALRQAMLTTRKQYPDPSHWAAFTLVGQSGR